MDTQICTEVPEAEPPTDPDSNVPRSRPAVNSLLQEVVNQAGQEMGPSIKQVGDQLATIPRPRYWSNDLHWLNQWNDRYPVSYRRARENSMTANAESRFLFPL